ncbi:diaminopropionate ammonia-lyase [Sinorhizobium meliloti]|uniref:diaminopropionate ammonia-lyase n=1 Tax=Rhizobium meliloti TaxID=382 RepID=UPI000FDAF6AE|nr:diaminopropionate ammonia-lyase [Sinorhizobium meliloti]MDW9636083.1 diaminopropionate ammonia-lyase [Sinorhizobium meliloti]MDW9766640.1 diaminopropionate ammonia-lyase [Sinorhizobium meliloti]MDW9810975.1 diaminopropionate ammonia-lyase [Sinorhizobium meliloti]MDW9989227.1 diaminopropionate ammonia-lyase [Sinorhizobium meliloti]MDX0124351.1 diaminopropionate ammonia-lyase [Sinorhizobium meliloti]
MLVMNSHPEHNLPLEAVDAGTLSVDAAREVERFLSFRANHKPTPLQSLSGLAGQLGVASIHMKDEGFRLDLGSFKALGGSYAVIRLVLEEASRQFGRPVDIGELDTAAVRRIAEGMTVGCATDGNHGKSVAAGAQLVGAKAAIFVHSGVSDERVAAIAQYGAEMIRIEGTYDDSVAAAERICKENGWIVVSDTSWPGYERIPGLVMQGYTAMLREAVAGLPQAPTHVFMQAGVGGLAAAVAGYFDIVFGNARPRFVVVEPDRAACLFASARAGRLVKVDHDEPTIMAMLECYEPSLVAWRILARKADAFMTVSEEEAAETMRSLARPVAGDPAIVAGESGGAGLAGFLNAMKDSEKRAALGLDANSRIFVINTEGATDQARYEEIVGRAPAQVRAAA